MAYKLSIAIVIYDNYNDVENVITSIDEFTSKSIKKIIYLIDNGVNKSKKEDCDKFVNFIKDMKNVIYIDAGANLGFGKGHNKVLDIIDSEYHAIVNPDILFCEDTFTKIVEWMDLNKDVGMTIPLIIDEQGNRQQVYRKELTVFDMFNRMVLKEAFKKRAKQHSLQNMDYTKPFEVPFGQGSFLVIRTDLYKQIKGFDDRFFMYVEDADLCKRVNQISKLMYYPDTKVIHKWEKGSHKNKTLLKYHIQSMIYYFKKWGWKIL